MPGEIPRTIIAAAALSDEGQRGPGGVNQVLTRFAAVPLRMCLATTTMLAGTGLASAAEGGMFSALSGPMTSLQVIEFSMFLGAMGAALLSAVWLIRERGKVAGENQSLRSRVADLTASLERSDALLASRDARTIIWDGVAEKPDLVGSMPKSSGVPQERSHFLAFGRWLAPQSAARLDRAVFALRERGTGFEMQCETITGQLLEVQGRRAGTTAFVRFLGLSDLQAQIARLRGEAEDLRHANGL